MTAVVSIVMASDAYCVCDRTALDGMAVQHKADLQQARQQALQDYHAAMTTTATQCEHPAADAAAADNDVSDGLVLMAGTTEHDTSTVSCHVLLVSLAADTDRSDAVDIEITETGVGLGQHCL